MNNERDDEPKVISHAREAMTKLKAQPRERGLQNAFSASIGDAWSRLEHSNDPHVQQAFVDMWLYSFQNMFEEVGHLMQFLDDDVVVVMDWLSDKQIVKTCNLNPLQNITLGCVCLRRVNIATAKKKGNNESILRLLRQWTGVEPKSSAMYSVEDCVKHLYGEACWDLYGSDTTSALAVPGYFFQNKVEPIKATSYQNKSAVDIALPQILFPEGI